MRPVQAQPVPAAQAAAADVDATAPSLQIATLRRRTDFLRAARARRAPMPGLTLQARRRDPGEAVQDILRLGITCSKKIGNAVVRNRAKRRLRAVARDVLPEHGHPGWDYVLIGRPGVTVALPFAALRDDLARALERIHGGART